MGVLDYLVEHFDIVWARAVEHLTISAVSVALAVAISLPVGVVLSRRGALAGPVLGVLGALYTVPSLALFALLVPFTGIGARPAITALVIYSLFILVRNTLVALTTLDPAVVEAARGMGMSGLQVLMRIELPLAMPLIVAGIRIASLSTIGLTTVAAWVGAGGLGQLLKDGINNPPRLYAGVIAVGLMALGADLLMRLLQRLSSARAHVRPTRAVDAMQPKEA